MRPGTVDSRGAWLIQSTLAKLHQLWSPDQSTLAAEADNNGYIAYPLMPMFCAYTSSPQSNVTGDGTTYTNIHNGIEFNQGSDYNSSTGIFTAPVNGKYWFYASTLCNTISSGHTQGYMTLTTSVRTFRGPYINPYAAGFAGSWCTFSISGFANLTVGQTAYTDVRVAGSTKTVAVYGSSIAYTFFQGFLVSGA